MPSRLTFTWMLAGQSIMLLPHWERLPFVISLLTGIALCYGLGRLFERLAVWPTVTKLAWVLLGWSTLWIEYQSLMVLDFWVGLLLLMYSGKLFELHRARDVYQVVFLGYFVGMTHFLFNESILQTTLTLLGLLTVSASLVAMHHTAQPGQGLKPIKKATWMFAQAIPLLLILFVFFPRLSPFWTIPLQQGLGVTGLSTQVTLGDISQLVRSDALAFRASFTGDPPRSRDLYWRTLVLSEFDGRTWRVGPTTEAGLGPFPQGESVDYSMLVQPTRVAYVPSLARVEMVQGGGTKVEPPGIVRAERPILDRQRFEMRSRVSDKFNEPLARTALEQYTRLPSTGSPRARAFADALGQSGKSPKEIVQSLLGWFAQDFSYTLNPASPLGDPIDHFLFDTQRGFCEHFASSFTFMMRAAGVPSRLVLGYQGGQYNEIGNYIEVRQFDAHAWSEVWIEQVGWLRIDPTAAIAPSRIESGIGSLTLSEMSLFDGEAWSYFRLRSLTWFYEAQLRWQAVSHVWDRAVVNYDQSEQLDLVSEFWPEVDLNDLGHLALGLFFIGFGVVSLGLLLPAALPNTAQEVRWYRQFQHLATLRSSVEPNLTLSIEHLHRAWSEVEPETADLAVPFVERFVAHRYQRAKNVSSMSVWSALILLRWKLACLRLKLLWRGRASGPGAPKRGLSRFGA
ncbi:MAG: transglutaminaseTgpA domain-containing protein [Pseudomonadales bacterium]